MVVRPRSSPGTGRAPRSTAVVGLRVPDEVMIPFAKVAECRRRGVVHFHAVIRLDGPTGPSTPPPAWATADALTQAVRHAAGAVSVDIPATGTTLRWGTNPTSARSP
ncbi:replication initiator [Nonomuraea sp. NPDC004354]